MRKWDGIVLVLSERSERSSSSYSKAWGEGIPEDIVDDPGGGKWLAAQRQCSYIVTMTPLCFEWDEAKNRENRRKHYPGTTR